MKPVRQAEHALAVAVLLPLLALCPGLAWIVLDRSVWPWDQAWFAANTVDLYQALGEGPRAWLGAMAHVLRFKPPAVAWIGQFFVPLGSVLGRVDVSLLLSVWVTHVAALAVLYRALWVLSEGRALTAAVGILVPAAAPLLIWLSTQYLAEGSQTLAVAWFVLIMVRAPAASRRHTWAHLVAAASFAMATKVTSPLYCVGPGLVVLFHLFARGAPESRELTRPRALRWWVLAFLLCAVTTVWYVNNLGPSLEHATAATSGPVAELFGKQDTFIGALGYWLPTAARCFFLTPVAALLGAVVLASLKAPRGARAAPPRHHGVCAAVALVELVLVMCAFSLASNRDPRYLEPVLPYVAVLVCWGIARIGPRWVAWAALGALGLQLVLVQTQALGLWATRPRAVRARIQTIDRDDGPARIAASVVRRTCGSEGYGRYNFVGADLPWLSGHSLTYVAAKERLAGHAGRCEYLSLVFQPARTGRDWLEYLDVVYWIALDPDVYPIPPGYAFLNASAPLLFRRLRERGALQPEAWAGPPGILLYRRVKR